MAEATEQLLVGTAWLPALLRTPPAGQGVSRASASGSCDGSEGHQQLLRRCRVAGMARTATRPRSYGGTIENLGRAPEGARRLHDPAPSTGCISTKSRRFAPEAAVASRFVTALMWTRFEGEALIP
jgi:hypothetical protein